jgi:hypothetical protein
VPSGPLAAALRSAAAAAPPRLVYMRKRLSQDAPAHPPDALTVRRIDSAPAAAPGVAWRGARWACDLSDDPVPPRRRARPPRPAAYAPCTCVRSVRAPGLLSGARWRGAELRAAREQLGGRVADRRPACAAAVDPRCSPDDVADAGTGAGALNQHCRRAVQKSERCGHYRPSLIITVVRCSTAPGRRRVHCSHENGARCAIVNRDTPNRPLTHKACALRGIKRVLLERQIVVDYGGIIKIQRDRYVWG